MKIGSYFVNIGSRCVIAGLVLTTISAVFSSPAIARDFDSEDYDDYEDYPVVQGVRFGQTTYEFEQTYFSHAPDFYRNRSTAGQIKRVFGPFPDRSIEEDAKDLNKLYQEVFFKQMNAGPIIRTIDLPSPFQFSLRTLPPPVVATPVEVVQPPFVVTPAVPAPVVPPAPVPALW